MISPMKSAATPHRPLFAPDAQTPLQQKLSREFLFYTAGIFALLLLGNSLLSGLSIGLRDAALDAAVWQRLLIQIMAALIFFLAAWLAHHQHLRAAALIVISVMIGVVAFIVFGVPVGVHAPALSIMPVIIIVFGLMCGPREAWLLGGLSAGGILFAWWAEQHHLLPVIEDARASIIGTLRTTTMIIVCLVSAWLGARFNRAIREAMRLAEAHAADALRLSEAAENRSRLLQAVTDATPTTIAEWDTDRRCLFANAAFARYIGATSAALIGRRYDEIFPPAVVEHNQPFVEAALTGESSAEQVGGFDSDSPQRWLVRYIPLRRDEQVTGFLSVGVDVTEMYLMERALEERTRQAEAASVAKSQFLRTVTHELRTPLNGILGNADLLAMDGFPEEERNAALGVIVSSGKHLLATLNQTLDLADIESGQIAFKKDQFSPVVLVTDFAAVNAAKASRHGLSLRTEIPAGEVQLYEGDERRVHQMVNILLDNAIKFSEKGEIVLGMRLPEPNQPELIEISVSDQGIGIAPEHLPQLFQSFVQLDARVTRHYEGTGLGLAIVRRLAEAMGGHAGVESTLGLGSRFWVQLRLKLVRDLDG